MSKEDKAEIDRLQAELDAARGGARRKVAKGPSSRLNYKIVAVGENGDEEALSDLGLEFWDAASDAERVFKDEGIRISSTEEIVFAAIADGRVVGAATVGRDEEEGETVYTFSVAVSSKYQKHGIGRKLVEASIGAAREESESGHVQFRVWVVNPNMAKLLESMGFDTEGREWTPDSPHMVKWV